MPDSSRLNLFLDARWYTRDEVLAVLQHKKGTDFTRSDYKQMASIDEGAKVNASVDDPLGGDAAVGDSQSRDTPVLVTHDDIEPPFRVPPRTAIAGVLISDWAFGRVSAEVGFKGRM